MSLDAEFVTCRPLCAFPRAPADDFFVPLNGTEFYLCDGSPKLIGNGICTNGEAYYRFDVAWLLLPGLPLHQLRVDDTLGIRGQRRSVGKGFGHSGVRSDKGCDRCVLNRSGSNFAPSNSMSPAP